MGQLHYPFRYKWYVEDGISVIGRVCGDDGRIQEGAALASRFRNAESRRDFSAVLKSLNGHFAVVIERDGITAAAVDHIRSFPVLYQSAGDRLRFYSDTADIEPVPDKEAVMAFERSWCVPGNRTLYANCRQLEAGQLVWSSAANQSNGNPEFYFRHEVPDKATSTREELLEVGIKLLDRVFRRLASALQQKGGSQVVIPLSGGYDSRLIIAMLKRVGVDNLLAYTYGRPDSHEARIARKVAVELDVPWHFVEYDRAAFQIFFSDSWKRYSDNNHFLSGLPHEQDFFALHALREQGVLRKDFTALPGYCGDLLGGSHTAHEPESWDLSGWKQFVTDRHFRGESVYAGFGDDPDIHDRATFYDAYQHYFAVNKVSKFIVNSVRVYEHFGGDWMMPLWDRELVGFFYALPYELRYKQSFYNDLLFTKIFDPMLIGWKKPGYDDNYPAGWKSGLKKRVPALYEAAKGMVRRSGRGDAAHLGLLNEMLADHLGLRTEDRSREVNDTHAKYFLLNLMK